jgi:hypothetical protein
LDQQVENASKKDHEEANQLSDDVSSSNEGIAALILWVILVPPTSYKDRRIYKYATTVLRHQRCLWNPCVANRMGNQ